MADRRKPVGVSCLLARHLVFRRSRYAPPDALTWRSSLGMPAGQFGVLAFGVLHRSRKSHQLCAWLVRLAVDYLAIGLSSGQTVAVGRDAGRRPWGLAALGAYPGVIISHCLMVLGWWLGRVLFPVKAGRTAGARFTTRPIPMRQCKRAIFGVTALAALGLTTVVVLSPTYLAFIKETAGFSGRSGSLPREVCVSSNALQPASLASLASPHVPMHAANAKNVVFAWQ